jgi:prefoldin subunit 5
MKNPMEVLRSKEQELVKVKKEIDALRTTVRLLNEEGSDFREGKVDLRQVIEMP